MLCSVRIRSLRVCVLALTGLSLLLFGLILFSIFHSTMPGMLLHAEDSYLTKQIRVVEGLFLAEQKRTASMTEDVAIWDETVRFVKGEHPGFISENWTVTPLLESYHFNFAVFKDREHRDLYVDFYDYFHKQSLPVPPGFTESLNSLTKDVLARNELPSPEGEIHSRSGIHFYQGIPYVLSIMPIMKTADAGHPAGTVVMGSIMDNAFFRQLTHYDNLTTNLQPLKIAPGPDENFILKTDEQTVFSDLLLQDIDGQALRLRLGNPRQIYQEGRAVLDRAGFLLLAATLGLAVAFYLLVVRFLARPVEALNRDIERLTDNGRLDAKKYARTREFSALCASINAMLHRLEQSRISQDVLRNVLNGLDVYLYVSDPETDEILFVNDKLLDLMRLDAGCTGATCWQTLRSGLTERCPRCPKPKLLQHPGESVVWEEVDAQSGRHYRKTARLITWSDNRLVHLQHTVDITESRQMEEKLVLMSSIVDKSPHYITHISVQGEFQYCNQGALDMLGYSWEEVQRGGIALFVSPEDLTYVETSIIPGVLEFGRLDFELPVRRKDGEIRTLSFSAFVVEQETLGVAAIAADITERLQMERELFAAKEQAEQSSKAKGDFLSRMSHEMRTPLNAIIGMTSIARSSVESERKDYCLDKVSDASSHLLGVINDILDMSKIEANKFELSLTEFAIEKMIMRVLTVVNFKIEEKEQNLVIDLDPALPFSILSDEQRLAQIIANLLSNAVKFTPEQGLITLGVRLIEEEDSLCTLQISVRDTGIGISRENQARLFSSFEQADGGIARKFGGTGLGLAISKSIVGLMGGSIWVESEEGRGSTFAFTLKARRGAHAARSLLTPGVNWSNLRLLAVDDAPEVREYFLHFARTMGLHCETAASGEEACALLKARADNPFHIIFADWKMPGMDGMELAKHVKESSTQEVVVIMISAAQWSEIQDAAGSNGVDRFLPKPLFSSQIVDCINECLGEAGMSGPDAPLTPEENCFSGRHILLAEDIEINREIVISLLQETGVTIDCAENGEQACAMFSADPTRYDLIFMDIHMPEVDGFEGARRIRALAHPKARSIPIVAMTANVFREDIERCLAAGMNNHIGKPIDVEQMFNMLHRYLYQ